MYLCISNSQLCQHVDFFEVSADSLCVTSRSSWRLRSNRFQHGFGKGYTPTLSSQSKDALLTNKKQVNLQNNTT